ncbi:MAG: hypothetical protein R3F21_08960 [Myxococcota bacterium]
MRAPADASGERAPVVRQARHDHEVRGEAKGLVEGRRRPLRHSGRCQRFAVDGDEAIADAERQQQWGRWARARRSAALGAPGRSPRWSRSLGVDLRL